MAPDLAKYANMKICVAVSGGKDSVALLHYIYSRGREHGITLTALNCDHKLRGDASSRDSKFVKDICASWGIPLAFFVRGGVFGKSEEEARRWRLGCYAEALKKFSADAVATAHHLNDNAETVLFNLARGCAASGLTGITDTVQTVDGVRLKIIRPLISCTRAEIDAYIEENKLPYVDDPTNFSDVYTRNKIRLNVLPELGKAVSGAAGNIYRLSRLVAEDENFFNGLIDERGIVRITQNGAEIKFTEQRALFNRAAVRALKECFNAKDYTAEHIERLYNLQFFENGKKFIFLGLTAYKETGKIVIARDCENSAEIPFCEFGSGIFYGRELQITSVKKEYEGKTLRFDPAAIPSTAVVRFMREGDRFTKFGGGTKNLGDYFTDKKIPVRVRKTVPLIADGNEILAVCGVEISDKIKLTPSSSQIFYIYSCDYAQLNK